MRLLAFLLATLLVAIQWPLWIGKGSWLKVWQIQSQVEQQQAENNKLRARNAALDAEVRDLKNGTDAIEERARNELGMVKQNEVFFQVLSREVLHQTTPPIRNTPAATHKVE